MEIQTTTPGYGRLNSNNFKELGTFAVGLANAKYASSVGGKLTYDPNRFTIRIDNIVNSIYSPSSGWETIYKIIDNYGRSYYRSFGYGSEELFKSRPEFFTQMTNDKNIDGLQALHISQLPDYLIDLLKGDYIAYNTKLMMAITSQGRGAAGAAGSAAAGENNTPSRSVAAITASTSQGRGAAGAAGSAAAGENNTPSRSAAATTFQQVEGNTEPSKFGGKRKNRKTYKRKH